jgi:hypothetical protein
MCHSPGMPFNGLMPRSAKRRPEPATRSFTVLEHLARGGKRRDTGANMNRDATHLGAHHFAFSGVKAGADFKPERLDCIRDGAGAIHGARRPIEGGEEAVATSLISDDDALEATTMRLISGPAWPASLRQ